MISLKFVSLAFTQLGLLDVWEWNWENMNMLLVGVVHEEERKEKLWNCCSVCKMKVWENKALVSIFST
jgi:hypothetical protein